MSSEPRAWWPWALAGTGLLLLAFFAGRYSKPTHIEERVRVQVVEKQVVAIQERVRVETVTVEKTTHQVRVVEREVKRPDGTVERTRTEESAATVDRTREEAASADKTTRESREREAAGRADVVASYAPRWRVGASAGVRPLAAWQPVYGGEAGLRVAGPFWVGLSVRTDGSVSAGLAMEF